MIHAIQIPADEERPLYKVAIEGLEGMQAAVGGYIEVVELGPMTTLLGVKPPLSASLVLNEEGKQKSQPINRRATLLFWLLFPGFVGVDVIVGEVLIVGGRRPDIQGDTTDVPPDLVRFLFETTSYKAEFQTYDDPDKFNGNLRRFDSFFEATDYGLSKARAWTAVQRVRVVAAEG